MNAKTVYEVTMTDIICPEEKVVIGVYSTEEYAKEVIAKERTHYDSRMLFEIDSKYLYSKD